MFDGLDTVEPGIVDVQDWRPSERVPVAPWRALAGVARVP
ncbi:MULTISPECIES: SAM-dependent methyltransferase [Actinomadura]|uniref:SAM-dependent methyltransferase n=1 Tax=Actinomadura yumaensis TaxID=111807 RepID=A0ABW2CRP8_9ACTN|nr:SAM-dependent methyltransferase [Actinomadura sp. J1-007]